MKHVIVLNQFAVPRTESAGTRHVEVFGRLDNWEPLIVWPTDAMAGLVLARAIPECDRAGSTWTVGTGNPSQLRGRDRDQRAARLPSPGVPPRPHQLHAPASKRPMPPPSCSHQWRAT